MPLLSKLSLELTKMVLFGRQTTLHWWCTNCLLHISDFPFDRNTIMYHFQFSGTYCLEESKLTSFLSAEQIDNAGVL